MHVLSLISPSANRFLAKKWDTERHDKHLKKIREMKPAIDNRAPIGFGGSPADEHERKRKDIKRASKESDRKKKIEQGNKKVLTKIAAIKHKTAQEWKMKVSIVKKSPFNPFLEKRMKEQKRIQEENEKLLQKIEMVKGRCTYDRNRFMAEYKKKEDIKNRISLFAQPDMMLEKPKKKSSVAPKSENKPEQPEKAEETKAKSVSKHAASKSVKPVLVTKKEHTEETKENHASPAAEETKPSLKKTPEGSTVSMTAEKKHVKIVDVQETVEKTAEVSTEEPVAATQEETLAKEATEAPSEAAEAPAQAE